jgi:hypothetical protein
MDDEVVTRRLQSIRNCKGRPTMLDGLADHDHVVLYPGVVAVRTFRVRACQSRIIIWPGMPSGVPQSNTDPPEQCAPSHDWRRKLLHVSARRAAVKAERKPRPSGRLAHLNRQAFDFAICRPIAAATRSR